MVATTSLNSKVESFIALLAKDYPNFVFCGGKDEHWSPKKNTITFNPSQPLMQLQYGVLHELAHALLEHVTYQSDFELLKLEASAWQLAADIGKHYGVAIKEDHIQNCLDTYRDWLHRRSTCPTCGLHVLQKDQKSYQCFNCRTAWRVSSGHFARPYRRQEASQK